ncbi:MAG: hypothetical protein CMJ53_05040 [Planctomycetaceae bacterium]|nr:hypothetical protein [Planctomycetaceae bacterium]|tara:strand:+ start:723 stop:1298 length:576 start_codon:yes stop_codon:yes gene_type:complete
MLLSNGREPPSTSELTAAIASGSTEAFASFYELWFGRCLESTIRMTGFDEPTALDIVQDTMMKCATKLPRFDETRQLEAWLDRVLVNAARDRIRAETRRRTRENRPVRTRIEALSIEDLELLDRNLGRLDEQQRSILHLRFTLGWSLQMIAGNLGLGGAGSIDGRIRRALEVLRKEYRDEHESQEVHDEAR